MYIYIDILIITNIYIDYLLIHTTKAITHSPMKRFRSIVAAFLGSFFSLIIFLPDVNIIVTMFINLISSLLIVYIAFGYDNKRVFLKRLFIYYLSSFVFAGVGTAIAYYSSGRVLVSRNGVLYADFSILSLIVTSFTAYASVAVYRRFACYSAEGESYRIIITHNNKSISFNALADTGNFLTDSFTGKPVIVCSCEILAELFDEIPEPESDIGLKDNLKWRFIPYHTASGDGLMPIVSPDSIYIKNMQNGELYHTDVYIGAAKTDKAVFHPRILI